MTKKQYEEPLTRVVELEQRMMLLAGSGESVISSQRSDYGEAEELEWQ